MLLIAQWVGLLVLGAWVTWRDGQTRTIPHYGLIIGLIWLLAIQALRGQVLIAVVSGGVIATAGWLLWRFTPLGGGDVKYWIVLGVALGFTDAFAVMAGAAASALLWGVVSGAWRRQGLRGTLAFGPWLAGVSVIIGAPFHW